MTSGAALETRIVGDITEDFWVPSYQRGYRWGAHEVQLLLDDLEASEGSTYHLQPVVVRPRDDGRWELIDGQQRLTTLYLLLRHMQRTGLQSMGPAFTIHYETRADSRAYLEEPDEGQSDTNIDFWHIHLADRAIAEWFDKKAHRQQVVANDIYGYLFKSVKIIWYVAPGDVDEVELFTRLNVGRIPLTNAELVKALVLTGGAERNQEVAAEWDTIERALRQPDLWAFASGRSGEEPTHISILLDIVAMTSCAKCRSGEHGTSERDQPVFHTFEVLRELMGADAEHWNPVWEQVVDLYSLVRGWFEDRDVFHRAGYLVNIRTPLRALVDAARGLPKSAFDAVLRDEIRKRLDLTSDGLQALDYETDSKKCEQVLLLMNVETVRRRSSSLERFPFAEHVRHAWSLEHIHAQNAQDLTKAEQWLTWLDLHAKALAALPGAHDEPTQTLLTEIDAARDNISETKFRDLAERILARFDQGAGASNDVHGISNLALLDRGINSALSNSVFEAKREHIVAVDRSGGYIPPATRNAFLKYYTGADVQQAHFWSLQDRAAYLDALLETVGDYLLKENAS